MVSPKFIYEQKLVLYFTPEYSTALDFIRVVTIKVKPVVFITGNAFIK